MEESNAEAGIERLRKLVDGFRVRLQAAGRGGDARLHETHISIVLLAGEHAYKFKKPVDFGFLDFSTLERRRHFCEREVALNQRFAADLYLGVESVHGASDSDVEPAVCMRRFDDRATLDLLEDAGQLHTDTVQALARHVAAVHAGAPRAASGSRFGGAALVGAQLRECTGPPLAAQLPAALARRIEAELAVRQDDLQARRAHGHVRECHGDLHLSNVVLHQGRALPFDCIEFSDELRIIDTMSDAAFMLADLDFHGQPQLGNVFLNAYLDASGDHHGLRVLPLYLAYRTLVLGKVALLTGGDRPQAVDLALDHVHQAERYLAGGAAPGLVITHGLSGSGKSRHAARVAAGCGHVHLRSDVERKRLAGLPADARSDSALDAGLYSAAHTRRTYDYLASAARTALGANFGVIIDATFLRRAERQRFRALAADCGASFHILHCDADARTLRERVVRREQRADDASEAGLAVLEQQFRQAEPLDDTEQADALTPAALADDDTGPLCTDRLGVGRRS